MRPGPEFSTTSKDGGADASPSGSGVPHSPWHSPVPYLFGGLAAMLGLIAFALLILACSYWKLSGFLESEGGGDGSDQRDGGKPRDGSGKQSPALFEEKILVIMAGDCKPTFIATPIASRDASFADKADVDDAAEDQERMSPVPLGDESREQHRQ